MYPERVAWEDWQLPPVRSAGPSSGRIVVVGDDIETCDLVQRQLAMEGYDCQGFTADREAFERLQREPFDLIVLNGQAASADWLMRCRAARRSRANHDVPIFVVAANADERQAVICLESGADDYFGKPFAVRELVARARALLRRPRFGPYAPAGPPITVHGIEIDPPRRRVRVGASEVTLSDQEFRLLYLLASHAGLAFTRQMILRRIWHDDTFVTRRSVDTLVKRLRRRIEADGAAPQHILTVWGVGYKFNDV